MSQQPNNIPPNNNHSRNSTPNMPTLPLYTNQSGNRGQPSQRGGGHRHGYPPSSHPPPSHPIPPSYAPNLGHPRAPPQARHNNNSHPPPNMSYPHPAHSAHPTRQQRHSVTNSSYPTHSVSSRISHTSHVSGSHTTPHPSQTVHTAHTAHTTHQTHQSTHNHNNHNNHAATPSVAQSAATVSSIGGPPPMQHQTSAGTTMTSMSTQSTISTMSAMGYKEIVERFRDFVKSYKQKKNDADFNHGQYMKIFGRIFEKVKNIFDGVGNDNNKYPEEVLKESEKELSPLFTELICHIIPPKYTTNNNISSDHGQEEKKKEDDIDVKLEILQWIGVSKYLSIMSMESITQILEHCVKTENAVIASHVYENILIQKLFVIRAKYKSWKIKHSQLMSRQSNNPNLSMGSPGKWLFDFFMGKEHAKNKHVLKALVLIMQIVKDITKKLQHPIQWLKNIYSVKNNSPSPCTKINN